LSSWPARSRHDCTRPPSDGLGSLRQRPHVGLATARVLVAHFKLDHWIRAIKASHFHELGVKLPSSGVALPRDLVLVVVAHDNRGRAALLAGWPHLFTRAWPGPTTPRACALLRRLSPAPHNDMAVLSCFIVSLGVIVRGRLGSLEAAPRLATTRRADECSRWADASWQLWPLGAEL
jgi:hypothetical protein